MCIRDRQAADADQGRPLCVASDGTPVGGHVTATAVTGAESKLTAYLWQWAAGTPRMVVVTYD